jgi:hypothetical protein
MQPEHRSPSRRSILVLAAILAATALTGGAAVTGLTRPVTPATPQAVPTASIVQQQPAAWGDD